MSRLRDNVERWLIHENYDFNQAKSEDTIFKITINNSDGLGNNTEVFEPKAQENILVIGIKIEMKTKQLIRFRELNEEEQDNFKKKIDDFCYSIKAVGKFLDEDGKRKVGVYIILDKQEQLNQPSFFKALEEIIDYQKYPILAAEKSTKARRSLGVGYIGLAHFLAKNKTKYEDPESWKAVHELTEAFQYYLLKASNNLAKERGACEYFNRTKYSDGILPIDTYKKEVDDIVKVKLNYDWDSLRADIKEHGLRHSTLSAQMPSESSSVVSNATNGIEPPRGYLSVKKSKKGPLKQIVPQYQTLKNNYSLLWDMPSNEGYINIVAVMQKFFDQAISGNWSYNPTHFENNEVPMSVMLKDLLTTYKLGWKTSYYQNTYDYKTDPSELEDEAPLEQLPQGEFENDEEECEACAI